MRAEIKNEDIKVLEKLAKKYDMSIVDFGKAIVSQTKKYNQRMFRVSESEYKEIAKKAERAGMNLMRYCECNIEIGTLIRYCALMNDCEV